MEIFKELQGKDLAVTIAANKEESSLKEHGKLFPKI